MSFDVVDFYTRTEEARNDSRREAKQSDGENVLYAQTPCPVGVVASRK